MSTKRIVLVLLIIGLAACMFPTYIATYQAKNDLVMKSAWRDFLQANPNPKVVLRVPDSPKDITQQEMMAYNSLYSFIEKRLLEANFTVRDRAMLTEVLRRASGELNYAEIGKKIDTDVIVEIVNVKLGTWMQGVVSTEVQQRGARYAARAAAVLQKSAWRSGQAQAPSAQEVFGAIIEGRIVMVSTGDIVGMFTLKEIHPRPEEWIIYGDKGQQTKITAENLGDADVEYLRMNITQKLIDFVKGQDVPDSTVTVGGDYAERTARTVK